MQVNILSSGKQLVMLVFCFVLSHGSVQPILLKTVCVLVFIFFFFLKRLLKTFALAHE